jgi:hypothetical protein
VPRLDEHSIGRHFYQWGLWDCRIGTANGGTTPGMTLILRTMKKHMGWEDANGHTGVLRQRPISYSMPVICSRKRTNVGLSG